MSPPSPLPRVNQSSVPSPHPPRPLLPIHATNPTIFPTPVTSGLLGTHVGALTSKGETTTPSMNDRPPEGQIPRGRRPQISPENLNNTDARVACYKCQGWGHFASQCPSPRQSTHPARATGRDPRRRSRNTSRP